MRNNLPVLTTKRLVLREIQESDMYDMFEYAQSPLVGPIAGWEPHKTISHTKEVIKMFIRKTQYGQLPIYAIHLKENDKMIGTIELHSYQKDYKAELGYSVNPLYWNQGYATEASMEVIKFGFENLNLKRIECTCLTSNEQSKKVCKKLGFYYEGTKKKGYLLYNGLICDLMCFAMTDDEYFKYYQFEYDNQRKK